MLYQDTTLDRRGGVPQHKAGGYPQPSICDRTCWVARSPQCTIDQLTGIDRGVIQSHGQ